MFRLWVTNGRCGRTSLRWTQQGIFLSVGPEEDRPDPAMAFMTPALQYSRTNPRPREKLGLRECGPVSACLGVYSDVGLGLTCQFWLATSPGASACCFWLFGDSGVVVFVLAGRVQRQSKVM